MTFLLKIRLIHDERSEVCDHEITQKSYSLLWLVGSIKDAWHKLFLHLICIIKAREAFLYSFLDLSIRLAWFLNKIKFHI